jgi:hypothetical protein
VVKEAIDQNTGRDVIAEHRTEILDGSVTGENGGAGLIAAGEDFEQVLGCSQGQGASSPEFRSSSV